MIGKLFNWAIKHIKLFLSRDVVKDRLIILGHDYHDEVRVSRKIIDFKSLHLKIDKSIAAPLIINYQLAARLVKEADATFFQKNKALYCSLKDVTIQVKTPEEIFILHEIWVDGTYNYITNANNKLVFIDVGMNVAFTSLYFAAYKNVEKIYAFEPFKPTFKQAENNIAMNPAISDKIIINCFGLSANDETLEVNYAPNQRGRTGIWGTDLIFENITEVRKEKLPLKSFNREISSIIQKHPNKEFVLKIDCEGSEHDIFKSIDDALLKSVRCIMMEWHRYGPKEIEQILADLGFSIITFNPNSKKVGMLYAFK